jgi:hypothetical protein
MRCGRSGVSWLGVVALGCAACVGSIGGDGDESGAPGDAPPISEETAAEIGVSGLRRLTVGEYQATVVELLGLEATAARELLPVDTLSPFDNDYTLQIASEALIKGAEMLAGDLAEAVIADATLRSQVVGCEPSNDDAACFESFARTFGRRALRRSLADAEVQRFVALRSYGADVGDPWVGVGAILRAFLQHPEFLYRVEIGAPVQNQAGVHRLTDVELASRLSYFLLGTMPPTWLIDAAEGGDLATPEGVSGAVEQLLDDPRARDRVNRFHAMWLSYAQLSGQGIFGQMVEETNALLERVIFDERRPWTDVLTSDETFLTPELAAHYGLPAPEGDAGWVKYGDSPRRGLFSQGAFLSAVAKFADTSPTQRGLLIRTRMFCEVISKPPPDLNVNVDMPPAVADPDACKKDRYYMSTEDACKACHTLMDPIGFGLEAYDATGAFRETELGRPDCEVDGQGTFEGLGAFNGPGELGKLAADSGRVEGCVAKQLYRFAIGRNGLADEDENLLERLVEVASEGGELRLDTFIREYTTSEPFRHRREEVAQ